MNRRELFKRIAATAAASGAPLSTISTAAADSKPALLIIESDDLLSRDTMARVKVEVDHFLGQTPFAGVKTLVLRGGMHLTFLDANGHVLNESARLDAPLSSDIEVTDLTQSGAYVRNMEPS